MSFRIRYHPLARSDLHRIANYVAEFAGAETGAAKVQEIVDQIDTFANRPYRGSIRDEIAPGLRLYPASKKGSVLFKVNAETQTVLILAITYAGQDWTRIVRERNAP